MDPVDLPSAQDACARQLRKVRQIGGDPAFEVKAEVRLMLGVEDDAAVRTLLAASRAQGIEEALSRQRARALAIELSHPAGTLAWWLQQPKSNIGDGTPDDNVLQAVAEKLRSYPSEREEPLEVQLLEVLRGFLGSFPRDEQKQMLLSLLADGMRTARRPDHAEAVQAIAEQHSTSPLAGVRAALDGAE
ncbi:hypothetical protein [Streptomyces luteireticuli]|uniref:Uncharacterized protein n=1 Tax=Streptomyces luteireticuli TaxID=173858 RepID=A0ABN0YMP7_9ACTN